MKRSHPRPGALLIVTMLIVSTVSLVVGLSLSRQSLQGLSMGNAEKKSTEVLNIADGCMQEALLQLSRSDQYQGGPLSFANGSCIITVNTGDNCPASGPF